MSNKPLEKILIVEDNQQYRDTAVKALKGVDYVLAANYKEAKEKLNKVDGVITDLFYPIDQHDTVSIGEAAIQRIKYGLATKFVTAVVKNLKINGIPYQDEIKTPIYIMGLHNGCSGLNTEILSESVVRFLSVMKTNGYGTLNDLVDISFKNDTENSVNRLFTPLVDYIKKANENQPLGYLVAEDAEKLEKPCVIVTSLAHSNDVLTPILKSVDSRGWKILEAKDGKKDSEDYWIKAYNILGGNKL